MFTLLRSAVDSPGVYVPPAQHPIDVVPFTVLVVCGLLVTAVALMAAVAAYYGRFESKPGDHSGRETTHRLTAVGLAGFTLIFGGLIGTGAAHTQSQEASANDAHAHVAYLRDVTSWLDAGYGIDADVAVSGRLTRSEAFVTDYAGQQLSVAIRETTTGDLALINSVTGAPLPHLPHP